MKARLVVIFPLLTLLTIWCHAASKPHVVMVLADDLGYGDLGCNNPDSKIPTPYLDRLAAEGMRFTDAHAPGSLCHPSRYGLMTGRYPFRAHLNWRERPCIEEGRSTLATLLKEQGYRTVMIGKWHLGFEPAGYDQPQVGGPADRGFEAFFGMRASTDIPPYYYIENHRVVEAPTARIEANTTEGWSPIQGAFWREGGIAPGLNLEDVLPEFTRRAVQEIRDHAEQRPDQPLFLYLALTAPHTPWLPSKAFQGRGGAGLYGEFTAMVDGLTGDLLQALNITNMGQDTLFIFSSDNGPVWYPADVERFNHDAAGGLRGMKGDLYEAGHRMPFLARWPGRVAPGSTSDHLVCFTDLFATLADLVDRPLRDGEAEDSFSFLPQLLGTESTGPVRTELVVGHNRNRLLLRQGDWAYLPFLGSGGFTKPSFVRPQPGEPDGQLYNLAKDPAESDNRWLQHRDRLVARMHQRLQVIKAGQQTRP